jgi:SAM-dependent methyltransferase
VGIAKGAVKFLINESRQRPLAGKVLTLGRQQIYVTGPDLDQFAAEFGVKLRTRNGGRGGEEGFLDDKQLLGRLGFDVVESLDFSDYEGATHIFDLNQPAPPAHLLGAYDVIIDGGTLEHVFHLPNALSNIAKMLKVGGRIIHLSPSSNHIDHGFYMFSPTLFWDFYATNDFAVGTFQVFRYSQRHWIDPWLVSDYVPGSLNPVSYGGLDDGMYGVACVVTKRPESTFDRVPQQGFYVSQWTPAPGEASVVEVAGPSGLKDRLRRHRRLFAILRFGARTTAYPRNTLRSMVRRRRQSKGLKLPVVARY